MIFYRYAALMAINNNDFWQLPKYVYCFVRLLLHHFFAPGVVAALYADKVKPGGVI